MHHAEHNRLTNYEKWIVDELIKYGTEDTNHFTEHCFEQTYYLGEQASMLATKLFYSSMFNTPKEARWAIDRILELPQEYKVNSLLHMGYSLALFYQNLIKADPRLDEIMRAAYATWIKEL
tara:strand:+ start:110 stop:472 length:363 start_codon:yes stop_codon:yes gene_type:complete